ncbi:hypothetical protein HD553DRAFT_344731 [Filobasidium floriforme]|uniref:uncharacterized protein n=1 Tax=Filobasidium floriforme TaxID=5210 RepID=UPI001E8DD761|nr:uncharacterized protein HD553DRAFT_344731 [Filobasidium floriforme]KAH8080960.1 hypothetical protein HD553DRAFT_344731 [Filobasidium floriforme]
MSDEASNAQGDKPAALGAGRPRTLTKKQKKKLAGEKLNEGNRKRKLEAEERERLAKRARSGSEEEVNRPRKETSTLSPLPPSKSSSPKPVPLPANAPPPSANVASSPVHGFMDELDIDLRVRQRELSEERRQVREEEELAEELARIVEQRELSAMVEEGRLDREFSEEEAMRCEQEIRRQEEEEEKEEEKEKEEKEEKEKEEEEKKEKEDGEKKEKEDEEKKEKEDEGKKEKEDEEKKTKLGETLRQAMLDKDRMDREAASRAKNVEDNDNDKSNRQSAQKDGDEDNAASQQPASGAEKQKEGEEEQRGEAEEKMNKEAGIGYKRRFDLLDSETGPFPSVSWPVPNIKLERPQQVRQLPKAVPIDKEALKDTFSKFAEWEQRSQGTGPKQNSRKRGLDIVTDVAEDVWDGARKRRGRTPRDFGDMDKGDDDGPRKKQKTGEAASLKPSRHEKKDFLGQVIYGIGRNLRSPIYRAGSRWQEPFPTGRFKNPDGLVRALDIAMKGVRRNPAHSVESWKEHVEREVQLLLGEGWNASEWTKVMEIGTDDGKTQPERLCAFFEFAWDSGAYGKAFNECHSPARAQAYGILAQAVEAREERWQGISKREIIRKINSLGKDGYNVLTKELERRWDEIIDTEERAAGCVHALLGDTFRDFRAVSEIDGRPHECDTPDKKQLWDVGRRYLTKATALREALGNVVRGCGWQDGVYMGREWMKGATPAFIAVVGGIFEVFANRPDFKSTSSLAGEIHYLRRLLGEGRFYESEWVPILA